MYMTQSSGTASASASLANNCTTGTATDSTTRNDYCSGASNYCTITDLISNEEDIDEVWLGIIDRYNREGQKRDQKEARQFYNRIVQNFQVGCMKKYNSLYKKSNCVYNKKLMFPNKKVEKWV